MPSVFTAGCPLRKVTSACPSSEDYSCTDSAMLLLAAEYLLGTLMSKDHSPLYVALF